MCCYTKKGASVTVCVLSLYELCFMFDRSFYVFISPPLPYILAFFLSPPLLVVARTGAIYLALLPPPLRDTF